ncbi:hypothetical protein BC941DRAFT_384857 [Chlamydoabsidia padenii]|nr:hypothetical protein BC941DRAFT_384857 [Chlamydoabsidia padenii]
MSRITHLASLLEDLNKYTPQNNQRNATAATLDPKTLAVDLATTTLNDITDTDFDYAVSLLFQRVNGLLPFLRSNVYTKESLVKGAQTTLLDFLASLFNKAKPLLKPYMKSIEQTCVVLACDGAPPVRVKSLSVLTELLKDSTQVVETYMNIKELYEKFSYELRRGVSSVPNTVKGALLDFLGTITKYHTDKVTLLQTKLLAKNCTNILSHELYDKSDGADNNIIAGALNGISCLLSNNMYDINQLSIDIRPIYNALKLVLVIPDNLTRYAAPIAGLELFIEHAQLLRLYLVQDYPEIYTSLQKLCGHQNRDIKKLGYRALECSFKQIGAAASRNTGIQERSIFNFYIRIFSIGLQQDYADLDFQLLSISVRGIGYFAKAVTEFMQPDELDSLQEQLAHKGTWLCMMINSGKEKRTDNLPSFIQSYTQIVRHFETVQPAILSILNKMTDSFVSLYSQTSAYSRQPGVLSIQNLIKTLYLKGEGKLRQFLSPFFYNSLISTCNDKDSNFSIMVEDGPSSYKELVYFWTSILNKRYFINPDSDQDKDEVGDNYSDSFWDSYGDNNEADKSNQQIHSILYDEFMTSVLHMIKALNLNVEAANEDDNEDNTRNYTNPLSQNLAPVNQKDFVLYQNLVGFWCTILPRLDNQRLPEWIGITSSSLIQSSQENPLVSGFYRMLATILTITRETNIFKSCTKNNRKLDSYQHKKTPVDEAYGILYDYIHQVWHRMKQFKDELLVSCLRLVLTSPLEFFDVVELAPPLQMAARFGLSYYPMATLALDTLESLLDVDSPARKTIQDDSSFLQSILPLFNEYLMMDQITEIDQAAPAIRVKLETKATRHKDQIHRKATNEELGVVDEVDLAIGLRDIQLRVMRFLGRLGGLNKLMLNSTSGENLNDQVERGTASHRQQQLLAWDPDRQLTIHVPFPNAGIELPMDELLPHICDLAESSPDRKIKVASGEFLHGVILVMIGNSAFQARDRRGPVASRYHQLYKHVFPVLVRLAIDLDQVIRDMFQALMAQLIHWLTNNAQYENPETIILLQTCLDAACSNQAALREYGATCIHEFVKWSIKQTSTQAIHGPMNIKSLLKRLYHLASHPSPAKRLGASMIFNHIYRLFREEAPLVDGYTLELLYYFMFSMRLAEDDHPSLGTQQKVGESISHLKRIIRVKSVLFLTESPNRRAFPGTDHADLAHVVEWCFQETGKTEREYAKACMEFFNEFTLVLPEIKDAKDWLKKKITSDQEYLTKIYNSSTLVPPTSNFNLTMEWLKQLNCALDGYVWLLERKVLSYSDCTVLHQNENKVSVAGACVHIVQSHVGRSHERGNGFSLGDQLKLHSLTAYNSYRMVCLVNNLLENNDGDILGAVKMVDDTGLLFHPGFSIMVASMLLLPHYTVDTIQAGQTSLSSWINIAKVRSAAAQLLLLIHENWSTTLLPTFCTAIAEVLSSVNINSLAWNTHHAASLHDVVETIKGVKVLQKMGLLDITCRQWHRIDSIGGPSSSEELYMSLFNTFLKLQNVDSPALIELLGNMTQLAFGEPRFAEEHCSELLGQLDRDDMDAGSKHLTIYQRYSIYINSCIALNFQQFAPYLVKHLDNGYIKQIIQGLLDYLRINKNTRKQEVNQFTQQLISTPLFLNEIYGHWSTMVDYLTLVNVMKGIFSANATVFVQAKSTPVYGTLVDILEHLLAGPYPLSIKYESFDLLPFFLQVDGLHINRISNAIKTIVNDQLPVSFSDLTPGSATYNDSLQALKSLLNIMSTFHSVVIFNTLIPTFMQDNGHLYQEIITPSVSIFANGLGLPSFKEIIQTCFNYFKNVNLYHGHRKKAVDLVASILFLVPRDYVIAFYETNIIYIMGTIKQDELRRGSDDEMILDLMEKACCFKLMQVLYELLPTIQVHSPQSKISVLWEQAENKPSQGRKMTIDLVSQAHQAKSKKHLSESDSLSKARLEYQQAAYNAAAASILRTQKSEKFFVGFLFQEKPSEPLWENIVDSSIKLDLVVELDQPLLKTRLERFGANSAMRAKAVEYSNPGYMASIGPTGSSLSQPSLSEIAIEALGQKETPTQPTVMDDQADIDMDDIENEVGTTIRGSTEIELDQLNSNPCMKLLGAVVQRLHTVITPPNEISTSMPMWMSELHKAFTSTSATLMQKLFLAKVIINSPQVFEHYAQFWIRPLIQLAMCGEEYGQPINYFVQDLCVIILTWGKIATLNNNESDRYLIYKFVNYLICHSYHENSGVLRNNIQTIKSAFDNWKKLIIVPTKSIYQQLSTTDLKSKKNLLGIQMAGVVLANELELYYDGPEVDMFGLTETDFYQALFGNLKNHHVEVAAASAEVIAWSLTLMKKRHRADALPAEIEKHLMRIIQSYNLDDKKDHRLFLSLVHRIHLHDDELCRPFLPKVFQILPHLVETSLLYAIEIVTGYANQSPEDIFLELKGKGLLKILNYRNDSCQVAILKLLEKVVSTINFEQATYLFTDLVAAFHEHSIEDCRNHYYGLLETLYDKFMDSVPLGNEIKVQILCGLVDGSEYIRNNIHLYLKHKFGMTNDIYERTKVVLKDMFMPPVENMYIFYATQMLLETTTDSYEYDKPLFDNPLPNAHFDDHIQHINTSWRRNLSMTPLFVASQDQQQESNAYLDNQLRQTQQTLEFSQTQASGGRSLMSTFGAPFSSQSSMAPLTATPSQIMASQNDLDNEKRQNQYANLRRRYVKSDRLSTSSFFINRQNKLKKNLQKYMALQKQQREKSVVMHRKYRVGELPDIQIKYSELIRPLQALGRTDPNVARILYTQLVAAIGRNAEVLVSKDDYKNDLIKTLKTNLDASTLFSPTTISSFLRVYFELDGQSLDSDLIKVVSQRSFNHHLGIAVLEKQIGSGLATNERPAKRIRQAEINTKLHASSQEWIDLATLYQDIGEPEIFQSLYRTHVATKDLPKRAVDAKIRGDIALSCNLLQESMADHHDDTDPSEYNLWAKEGLRCFEQLTQWDDVSFHVTNDLNGDYELLWNKEYQVPYLHYFLRSNIKLRKGILDDDNNLVEWTKANPNPVFPFLRQSMQSKDKLDYLIKHHAAEISLAAISMDDFDRGRHFIRQSYESLQSTWTSLHPLSKASRIQQLATLQKNVELEDFLDLIGEYQRNNINNDNIDHYIRTLQYIYPDSTLDGMDLWDDVIDSRFLFLDILSKKIKSNQPHESLDSLLSNSRKQLLMEMVSAARQQNNFNVAIDRWQRLLLLGNVESYQRNYAFINIELQRCLVTDDFSKQSKLMARTLGSVFNYKLPDQTQIMNTDFTINFHLTAGKVIETARIQLQDNPSAYQDFLSNKSVIKHFGARTFTGISDFVSQLVLEGHNHLLTAHDMATEQSSTLEAECSWKFGDYCDNALRANENSSGNPPVSINSIQYSKIVVNSFFRAIYLGQQQAAERFPRLLELIERYPSAGDDFRSNVEKSSVTWHYIRWIPQLVAILDKPIAKYVFPMVLKLAEEYPAALYYPFQLSNEHYECYKEQLDPLNREAIMQIKTTIKSPLMETFTCELRRLTNPEHIVKDFIDFIMSVGQKVDVNSSFLEESYQQFCNLLLDPTNSRLGTIPKAFAVKHASQLREILGKNGSKIKTMSDKQHAKLLKYYQNSIQNQKLPGTPDLLKSYSPWLSTFQSTNFKEQIELPGQYHGRSPPDPESHVKIASFDDRILVMGSLRKPKRLRINGTDGNESMFLVKGGEDLRLDQRIQQLFTVTNELIRKEPYCKKHDVHLTTYNVIPMATNIGMIEWVQDTKPLRNCIEEQLNNKGLMVRVQENYRLFVAKFKGEIMGYHNLFKAPREPVMKNFQQQTGSFQDNILKQYLMQLATSPEAFIFMRNNFAHSLGAIAIVGYLFGIGDRHLENIMVDKKRGTLLAIDFGHAFGSATELLPVPEMTPFRLTRQLVGALEPLGVKGILEVIMVHTLEAVQRDKQVILNVMDVFVKEPLLDWKKVAAKQAKAQKRGSGASVEERSSNSSDFMAGSSSSTNTNEEYEWYPQQKLEIARKKLDGVNPTVIMLEELEHGHSGRSYLKSLQKVVKGDKDINMRANVGDHCQNTLEQVQCLIDLATDPNILGRTWAGWQSYI